MDKIFRRVTLVLFFVFIIGVNTVSANGIDNVYGISKVNKVLKNEDGARYILVSNEKVRIGYTNTNNLIVIDPEGHVFNVDSEDIEIKEVSGNFNNLLEDITVKRNNVINSSFFKLNTPYVYGAVGPASFDCSGFVYQIYKNELGIDVNRVSRDQFNNGITVSRDRLLPGDLVFFKSNGVNISHVGIYIGEDNMIHASSGAKKVVVSSLNSPWYNSKYAGARRLLY